MVIPTKDPKTNPNGKPGEPAAPRSGRACLACRKLKTRCDNETDEPPCKRCKAGGHECVFVESKRGKRPQRKPTDATLAEKFKSVEKQLSAVLSTMNAGSSLDPSMLTQLQSSLQDSLTTGQHANTANDLEDSGSPMSDSEDMGSVRSAKRSRQESFAAPSTSYNHPPSITSNAPTESPRSAHSSLASHISPRQRPHQLSMPPHSPAVSSSLSLLADASLAAEIEGSKDISGLDPSFNLSSVTQAIQMNGAHEDMNERTPALLSKGIIDPETAVELFRIFFDYAYIHLPLLDPSQHTATAVCAKSPFLFTVICAVASRFHSDPNLHVKCYDEAHACFVDCVANGERSIESVQACMILTVWTNAPKKAEDRPQRAWLYFGMAVRMALEIGLFRPPEWIDIHLKQNSNKANPWVNLKGVSEEEQREALNRERTWLMAFVIDRNMSAVMGRPYQIHEAKPLLIPLHPMSLPFDLGVIAHQELQSIIGQVMDTFRDRIYGLQSASDEMPSPVVLKLFNSRMDEWRQRWCPVPGEPIANNLLFYFYSSKLFLNTFPLHTMLRNGDASDDPECVSLTISSAKAILDLGHKYAELGVLRHCPDVNFLLLLYAAVFLIKVKASNTRFSSLVDTEELQHLLVQAINDCQAATCSQKHAAATCMIMLRALFASWRAMRSNAAAAAAASAANGNFQGMGSMAGGPMMGVVQQQHHHSSPHPHHSSSHHQGMGGTPQTERGEFSFPMQPSLTGTLANAPSPYIPPSSPFGFGRAGTAGHGGGGGSATMGSQSGTHTPSGTYGNAFGNADPLDSFLTDTHFFNSVLVSQGQDGFFSWNEATDSALELELPDFTGGSSASTGMVASASGPAPDPPAIGPSTGIASSTATGASNGAPSTQQPHPNGGGSSSVKNGAH